MHCPRCDFSDLREIDRDGVTIDQCPECRGIWLDRGELEKLIARTTRDFDEVERRAPPRGAVDHERRYGDEPRRPKKRSWFDAIEDLFD